jgi:hypothetical protein
MKRAKKLTKAGTADLLLTAIYDEVNQRLNPSGDDCWNCAGEGTFHDCIDDCCEDSEIGCDDCTHECTECVIFAGRVHRAVRLEIIASNDPDLAIAWLKDIGRWRGDIPREEVIRQLSEANERITLIPETDDAGRAALKSPPAEGKAK